MFAINVLDLRNFTFSLRHFQPCTPNRWALISKYVSSSSTCLESDSTPSIHLGRSKTDRSKLVIFNPQLEKHCHDLAAIINENNPELLDAQNPLDVFYEYYGNDKDGFKAMVFLPPIRNCVFCGSTLSTIARPSFPFVYTEHGTHIAVSYTSECRVCENKPRYTKSHYTTADNRNVRNFYKNDNKEEFILITSQTAFCCKYMKRCAYEVEVMGASFEGMSEVYNCMHHLEDLDRLKNIQKFKRSHVVVDIERNWQLCEQRLEEAWFIFKIKKYCESVVLKHNHSGRLDIENMCEITHDVSSYLLFI